METQACKNHVVNCFYRRKLFSTLLSYSGESYQLNL